MPNQEESNGAHYSIIGAMLFMTRAFLSASPDEDYQFNDPARQLIHDRLSLVGSTLAPILNVNQQLDRKKVPLPVKFAQLLIQQYHDGIPRFGSSLDLAFEIAESKVLNAAARNSTRSSISNFLQAGAYQHMLFGAVKAPFNIAVNIEDANSNGFGANAWQESQTEDFLKSLEKQEKDPKF